jgi:HPt (histidine-containing phosphotransfer) domain-containing protein
MPLPITREESEIMSQHNEDPIVVRVDPDLADLVPGFLENRRKDAADIEIALQQADYETVRIRGHDMKGSGGGYGFDKISDIGRLLEQAAKDSNTDAIQRQLADLLFYLNHLQVNYE